MKYLSKKIHYILLLLAIFCIQFSSISFSDYPTEPQIKQHTLEDESNGPLGQWPDFTPLGYITAPHPDYPDIQTYLYGDWGSIVGEEFIFIQDNLIKLLYHSYHETYMTFHPLEEEILHDWALGYDKITKIKFTPLVSPGGPIPGSAWEHTDTPGYIQHPITGEHLIYNTVRPGTKQLHPEWDGLPGWEGAIQVSTSDNPPTMAVPFNQTYENILEAEYWWEQGWNNNGEIKGGLSEPTPVWDPHLGTNGKIRLFYRGLTGSVGSNWNWRISYADSEDGKTGWVKNPNPTFDPSDPSNPAYQWTLPYPQGYSFRGAWQADVTGDERADGVHMVLTVSNQNFAGGGAIAYYWSPDWGDTWIGHPDNPIIIPGQFENGVPLDGFQRTPTLCIDEENNRYILAYNAGLDIDQPWQRRTYIATAPRPPMSQSPQAFYSYDPAQPYVNEPIQFTDLSTDSDGYIVNWSWDFGDGTIGYEQNPTHTFTNEYLYNVCLNVTDNDGYSGETCELIYPIYPIEQVDIEQTVQDRGFPVRHAADGDWGAAQNFIPTAINITKAELYLRKFGPAEFNLTIEIRESGINGPILDQITLTPEEVPTTWSWMEFDFTNINVTPDIDYFIKIPPAPNGVTTSFGYEWGYAFGNQYDDGAFWFTRNGGALWRDLPTMYEFVFRIYGYM